MMKGAFLSLTIKIPSRKAGSEHLWHIWQKKKAQTTKKLVQKTLSEGLTITNDEGYFTIFRDHTSKLEYIRENRELAEKGLYVEVGPYNYHTFLDFREVCDNEWRHYAMITGYLNGRGVPDIEESMQELFLQPIHNRFKDLVNPSVFRRLIAANKKLVSADEPLATCGIVDEIEEKMVELLREIKHFASGTGDETILAKEITAKLNLVLSLPRLPQDLPTSATDTKRISLKHPEASHFGWLFVHSLGSILNGEIMAAEQSRGLIDEWMLDRIFRDVFDELGFDDKETWEGLSLIKIFTAHQNWNQNEEKLHAYRVLESFMNDSEVQQFLQINRYKEILWFNKETFELLLSWLLFTGVIGITSDREKDKNEQFIAINDIYDFIEKLHQTASQSQYQVGQFVELIKNSESIVGSMSQATGCGIQASSRISNKRGQYG